jgi:hypothetical protein
MKCHNGPRTWADSLDEQLKLRKMAIRFGTWNGRRLYMAGSHMLVGKETSKYKFDLVGVQEVRRDRGGTEPMTMTSPLNPS